MVLRKGVIVQRQEVVNRPLVNLGEDWDDSCTSAE